MITSPTPKVSVGRRLLPAAIILGAAWSLIGCDKSISDRDIRPISLTEVRALTDSGRENSLLLIDPRSPASYARGHLPGARNMALETVPEDGDTRPELERYSNLVVYGDDPGSGTAVAMTKRLMTAGYKNVRLFFGGVSEWRRAGLEIRTSPGAEPAPAAQ